MRFMTRPSTYDDGNTRLNLPYNDQGTVDALGTFDKLSKVIVSHFLSEQLAAKAHSSRKTFSYVSLKRNCYVAISEILLQGHKSIFELRLRQYARYSRRRFDGLNPFQRGLLAIFAHDTARDNSRSKVSDDKPKELLSAKNRHIFGQQMWQAFRHYVPPEFLNGFVWETGGSVARPFGRHDGFIMEDYEEWVIREFLNDESNVRGRYPSNIVSGARARLREQLRIP